MGGDDRGDEKAVDDAGFDLVELPVECKNSSGSVPKRAFCSGVR